MSRTFIRQDTQIRSTDTANYSDAVALGATMESAPVHLEEDLNNLRSVMKDLKGETKWYTARAGRDVKQLGTDLLDIEGKKFLFRSQVLTDVSVTAAQNWEVLDFSLSETPSQVGRVGASVLEGAVVAAMAGVIGSNSLNEVAGLNAISPKNLVIVRDSTTGQVLQSAGRDIFGLIQVSSAFVEGTAFSDTVNEQAQISFVRLTAGLDDLEACPSADIAGKTINYSYVRRMFLDNIPEDFNLGNTFIDQTASVDVTLDNAIDNQSGPASQVQNIDWRITDSFSLDFQTSDGGRTLLSVAPAAAGDVVSLDLDTLDINNVNSVDILNGVVVDSGGTALSLGVVAGELSSAGALALKSAATFDLTLEAGGEFAFVDTNKAASTYAGQLKLAETAAEWSAYETKFGEVSLLNAITQAANSNAHLKYVGVLTTDVLADTNVTSPTNLDAALGDYSTKTFISDVDVYLNGVLLRNGADATANNDVYPGTAPATGDLKFEFKVKTGDVLTMNIF